MGEYRSHYVPSKVHFDGFSEGSIKSIAIQKMSGNRFGVMASNFNDQFYKVLDEQELQSSFDETTLQEYQEANKK